MIGPNATIAIGGDLNMAVDPDGTTAARDESGNPNTGPGKSTLHAVITAATHSPVNVTGIARLTNGVLKVKLDGYTPTDPVAIDPSARVSAVALRPGAPC